MQTCSVVLLLSRPPATRRPGTHHALGVGHKVRRDVAALKLHPLDDVHVVLRGAALLHRHHALAADALHCAADEVPDLQDGMALSSSGVQGFKLGGQEQPSELMVRLGGPPACRACVRGGSMEAQQGCRTGPARQACEHGCL